MRYFRDLISSRPELAAGLIAFAMLGVYYSVTTPVFEASDEISHYPVVEHIARTGQLPIQVPGVETLWEQEGSQPPLYYMLSAGLTFWIDTSDIAEIRWRNPHAKIGIPLDPDNTNMIIHTEAEQFPWQGTVLAIHIARLFSVVLGTCTVFLSYMLVRDVWPKERWVHLGAVALVAFNPMLLFITGSVNNDNLMILMGTWILLLCARIIKDGITLRRAATLAIVGALATLTKISGWTFMPLIGLALLIHVWQGKWAIQRWKESLYSGFALIGAWVVLSGWWYLRNWRLYNEFLGTNTHVEIVGGRSIGFWEVVTTEWYSFWVAYWGWFGAVNILFPQWVYYFFAALQIGALLGLGWVLSKSQNDLLKWLPAGLMAFQTVVVVGGIIRWTMTTMGSQGRLLFPVIGGVSALTAYGLLGWLPNAKQRYGVAIIAVPLLILSAAAPLWVIRPAYQLPTVVSELPSDAEQLEAHYGPLELVGVTTTLPSVNPGGWVPITVYWRLNEETDIDYSTFISVTGRELEEIGKLDTYPGGGALPTSRMDVGVIHEDHYTIQVDEDFATPTAIRALIGVGRYEGEELGYTEVLEPVSASGDGIGSVISTVAVGYPIGNCDQLRDAGVIEHVISGWGQFGDLAQVEGDIDLEKEYTPGSQIRVKLVWRSIGTTPDDWTIFLHLVDNEGTVIAQADAPPLYGDYPTSLWREPCRFFDNRVLDIPAQADSGTYEVLIGLYNADAPSFPRVPVVGGGTSVGNAVSMGVITVVAP